jgi:hypothetical protein
MRGAFAGEHTGRLSFSSARIAQVRAALRPRTSVRVQAVAEMTGSKLPQTHATSSAEELHALKQSRANRE